MSEINDGGSAFPEVFTEIVGEFGDYRSEVKSAGGMTLRDYFAAKAMQSFCSRTDEPFDVAVSLNRHEAFIAASFADFAYRIADAMLKARDE